jgi:hypothetical protein
MTTPASLTTSLTDSPKMTKAAEKAAATAARKAEIIAARVTKYEAKQQRDAVRFAKMIAKEAMPPSLGALKKLHETPEWESGPDFPAGSIVKHNGVLYIAKWYHPYSDEPGNTNFSCWMVYDDFKKQERSKIAKAKRDEKAAAKAAEREEMKQIKKYLREAKRAERAAEKTECEDSEDEEVV